MNLLKLAIYFKKAIEKDKKFVTLYHIRNVGGAPKPNPLMRYDEDGNDSYAKMRNNRHWLSMPLKDINGIFLTTNPYGISLSSWV